MKSKVMPTAHNKIRGYLLFKIGGGSIRDVRHPWFAPSFSCSFVQQLEKLDVGRERLVIFCLAMPAMSRASTAIHLSVFSPTELREFMVLGEMKIRSHLFCSIKQIDATSLDDLALLAVLIRV